MSYKARKIWLSLFVLLLTQWIVGCSSRGDEPESPWDGELYLQLRVHALDQGDETGLSRSLSRADDYYFELPDLASEKMNSLRVIIVKLNDGSDSRDTIMYNRFEPMTIPETIIGGLKYKIEFATSYNIYVIANESGLPESVQTVLGSLAEGSVYETNSLENIEISAEAAGQPIIDNMGSDGRRLIPMTEKFSFRSNSRPVNDVETYTETIYKDLFVTRAVSKFSFNFYKSEDYAEDNPLEIRAVRIYGLGEKEYFIPKDTKYSPDKDLPSDNQYKGRLITEFAVPLNNASGDYTFNGFDPVTVSSLTTPDDASTAAKVCFSPELYFPETHGRSREDEFMCSISFDGETYLKPVKLPNLSALPRNTHVVVNITIMPRRAIVCEVDLVPYRGCVLDPWFGLDPDAPKPNPTPNPDPDPDPDPDQQN